MKPLAIVFLFVLTTLRLQAAGDPVPDEGEWGLAARKAQMLFHKQQFAEAEQSSRQALQIAKRSGDSDTRIAMTYYQLGNIYRDWGHCSDARSNYSRSIASWEKQPGAKPRYILNALLGLLGTLCECAQFDVADKTFRKFGPKLQLYQSDPLDEARVLTVRGAITRGRKEYAKAEVDYRRAVDLLEHDPGSTQLEIEEARSNLASVIDKQGRHAEALALSGKVIAYFDRAGDVRPISFLAALNNTACSLADLGRKQEAQRVLERAVSVARTDFGEDSPFTGKIMLNYARVLRENKEVPAAEVMQKKGSEALRRALVRDSATVDIRDLR